jgi:hypothetical protein
MWGSGVRRKRRHFALGELVNAAARSGDYRSPWNASPQVWELFRDEGDILRQLQHDWRTALAGAVYVAIESGDGDLQYDVLRALDQMKGRHQAARRILEENADHPAIAAAMAKERALLSSFTRLLADARQVA